MHVSFLRKIHATFQEPLLAAARIAASLSGASICGNLGPYRGDLQLRKEAKLVFPGVSGLFSGLCQNVGFDTLFL
jgi:hypothetical protein